MSAHAEQPSGASPVQKKDWKSALLSSSIPLEYSVRQLLHDCKVSDVREYKYRRTNRSGVDKVFSVDVFARHSVRGHWLALNYLIECKYTRPDKRWVFAPEQFEELESFDDLFMILDDLCEDRHLNSTVLQSFNSSYPVCGKGVELGSGASASTLPIRRAISQLRFALVDRAAEVLKWQLDASSVGHCYSIEFFLPIVITTADLWRLRSDATVERIQAAGDLAEVADRVDVLLVREPPDSLAEVHTEQRIRAAVSPEDFVRLRSEDTRFELFSSFLEGFCKRVPRLFVVMNYRHLPTAISRSLGFYRRSDLVIPRPSKG